VPLSAPLIRSVIQQLLERHLESDDLSELLTAVGEAVANAVRHGRGPLQAHVELTEQRVVVRVRDNGAGFDPHMLYDSEPPSSVDAETGRGLYIMRRACDQVIVSIGNGTVVAIIRERRRNGASALDHQATEATAPGSTTDRAPAPGAPDGSGSPRRGVL